MAANKEVVTSATFVEIFKTDKQADGTLLVYGKATDDGIDSDQQICDPEWLKSAMPEWFRWGNIREQHSSIAAGVATEYEAKEDGHYITAHVVDGNSVKKVESGVLKGFSIGIRAPRVVKDNKAIGGRIVDGQIVEVSLVDRPANPNCTLSLAKAINGELTQTEELVETKAIKPATEESSPEESTAVKAIEESTAEETHEESTVAKAADEATEMTGTEESTASKAMDEETKMCDKCNKEMKDCKCAEGGYSATEKADAPAEESSQKPGEESSQEIGEESSREGGVAGVAGKSIDIDSLQDAVQRIEKQLAILVDAHTEAIAKAQDTEGIAKAVTAVTERLSVVEKAASSNGPARMAVHKPVEKINENLVKAAHYREKAMSTSDPKLAEGYSLLAEELEKSL